MSRGKERRIVKEERRRGVEEWPCFRNLQKLSTLRRTAEDFRSFATHLDVCFKPPHCRASVQHILRKYFLTDELLQGKLHQMYGQCLVSVVCVSAICTNLGD